MEDGLDSDAAHIIQKGSLQEVKTWAVVPVRRLHAEKERIHTPTLRQVQPKQTRSLRDPLVCRARQRNIWLTYPMDGYLQGYIDNTWYSSLLNK